MNGGMMDAESTVRRPWDELVAAGPPMDSLKFPAPVCTPGRRTSVLCYRPQTGSHELLTVLHGNFSRHESARPQNGGNEKGRLETAYWTVPEKAPITTIAGHIEIALVLERRRPWNGEDVREGDEHDNQQTDFGGDDDVVFEITDKSVAIKVCYGDRIESLRNKNGEDPLQELAAMQLVGSRHPHVLGCMEAIFDGTNLNIVMRYCNGGDLFELLHETRNLAVNADSTSPEFSLDDTDDAPTPGLPERQARYLFRQIMLGVHFLHDTAGICHRDLSPENIVIDHPTGAVIIDLGMCLRVPYSGLPEPTTAPTTASIEAAVDNSTGLARQRRLFTRRTACGKLQYMSPEIYRSRDFDGAAVDVWTAGTILFCMVTGNRSYERPDRTDRLFRAMTRSLPQLLVDWGVQLSPAGTHLLQNMLQRNPRLRLTIDEVLNHPWMQEPDEVPAVIRHRHAR
jgi:serine/threonine protein kinase